MLIKIRWFIGRYVSLLTIVLIGVVFFRGRTFKHS